MKHKKVRTIITMSIKAVSRYIGSINIMLIYAMRFRKPCLRVKLVNFDFSAKSSSTDYNELNKPTLKSLAHIGSEKSLVEVGVPKNEFFHFFRSTEEFTFYTELWVG